MPYHALVAVEIASNTSLNLFLVSPFVAAAESGVKKFINANIWQEIWDGENHAIYSQNKQKSGPPVSSLYTRKKNSYFGAVFPNT